MSTVILKKPFLIELSSIIMLENIHGPGSFGGQACLAKENAH